MKNLKETKGITLIALIITIIVMLILVGVSVSTAINTGLFKTASGVAQNTQLRRNEELDVANGLVNIKDAGNVDLEDYVDGLTQPAKEYAVGTKVTVRGAETEIFRVLKDEGAKLVLVGTTYLDTETLKQSADAQGIKFSTTNYWADDYENNQAFIDSGYDINMLGEEAEGDAIYFAKKYASDTIKNSAVGRLLTLGDTSSYDYNWFVQDGDGSTMAYFWTSTAVSTGSVEFFDGTSGVGRD